jgi:hypothetical protein
MDMDVEAMLEAPYQEKPHVEESTSQRSNGRSDSRNRDDHRRFAPEFNSIVCIVSLLFLTKLSSVFTLFLSARLDIQRPPDMIVHDLVLIVTIIDPVAVPDIVAADIEVAQETTDVRDPVREITIIPAGDPTPVVDEEEVEAHVDKAEAAGHTSKFAWLKHSSGSA